VEAAASERVEAGPRVEAAASERVEAGPRVEAARVYCTPGAIVGAVAGNCSMERGAGYTQEQERRREWGRPHTEATCRKYFLVAGKHPLAFPRALRTGSPLTTES